MTHALACDAQARTEHPDPAAPDPVGGPDDPDAPDLMDVLES